MAFHTFFFTSFLRKVPLLRWFIARGSLSLQKAIELRLNRQSIARQSVQERLAFNKVADAGQPIRALDHSCATRLCGKSGVEISLPHGILFDIDKLAEAWKKHGYEVSLKGSFISCRIKKIDLQVFPSARVMVMGTRNRDKAIALYQDMVASYDVAKGAPLSDPSLSKCDTVR